MYWYKPRKAPKWHELRKWAARLLVSLAKKAHPRSEDVAAFHITLMTDMLITGKSIVRLDPLSVYEEPAGKK